MVYPCILLCGCLVRGHRAAEILGRWPFVPGRRRVRRLCRGPERGGEPGVCASSGPGGTGRAQCPVEVPAGRDHACLRRRARSGVYSRRRVQPVDDPALPAIVAPAVPVPSVHYLRRRPAYSCPLVLIDGHGSAVALHVDGDSHRRVPVPCRGADGAPLAASDAVGRVGGVAGDEPSGVSHRVDCFLHPRTGHEPVRPRAIEQRGIRGDPCFDGCFHYRPVSLPPDRVESFRHPGSVAPSGRRAVCHGLLGVGRPPGGDPVVLLLRARGNGDRCFSVVRHAIPVRPV